MTVLKIAISTSIVNTFGGITPRSYPTLSMISSISARVFIMIPAHFASAWLNPAHRAAKYAPAYFPNVAPAMSNAHQPQSPIELSPLTFVFNPVAVKNIGRKKMVTKSATFVLQTFTKACSWYSNTPAMKPPKMAKMPSW